MSGEFLAPAWSSGWLNAWLAGIGVTVLLDEVMLSWDEGTDPPVAVFGGSHGGDLPDRIAAALPTLEELDDYGLARRGNHRDELKLAVTRSSFAARSPSVRDLGDFVFASAVTDTVPPEGDRLPDSPFNPPVPRGLTLWERFRHCLVKVDGGASVEASMLVGADRVKANGLGFDYHRIPLSTDPHKEVWVDPVVEVLAFFGLSLIPVRGDGSQLRVRGWFGDRPGVRKSEVGAFRWPVWATPLDVAGIDAYLDRHWSGKPVPDRLAVYETVPYQWKGSERTRGFASRRAI